MHILILVTIKRGSWGHLRFNFYIKKTYLLLRYSILAIKLYNGRRFPCAHCTLWSLVFGIALSICILQQTSVIRWTQHCQNVKYHFLLLFPPYFCGSGSGGSISIWSPGSGSRSLLFITDSKKLLKKCSYFWPEKCPGRIGI